MAYDVVVAGGGPAGLAAALTLGRARKRVLLCDAGPPRNAAAVHVHNFVTRDGVTPAEFRRIGREQLAPYAGVEIRDERIEAIHGSVGRFEVRLRTGRVLASRVLLCTGMIDEIPDIEGMRELWGTSIFQCPYCHGWEAQDRRFGYLLEPGPKGLAFAPLLRGWTADVVAFTNGAFEVPAETRARLEAAGVQLEERRIARLLPNGDRLGGVELAGGECLLRDVLFLHAHQRQAPLVRALDLALDDEGYVRVDANSFETSVPGVYAAGDLITSAQSAMGAAAAGARAAGRVNQAITTEQVTAALA